MLSFINMYQAKKSWKSLRNIIYSCLYIWGWGVIKSLLGFLNHNTVILLTFLGGSIVVSSILLGSFLLSITGDLKINKKQVHTIFIIT